MNRIIVVGTILLTAFVAFFWISFGMIAATLFTCLGVATMAAVWAGRLFADSPMDWENVVWAILLGVGYVVLLGFLMYRLEMVLLAVMVPLMVPYSSVWLLLFMSCVMGTSALIAFASD